MTDHTPPDDWFEVPWWQERYGGAEPVWSGRPNSQLVAQVGDLTPGAALDIGCGEGADAIWLAEQGWTVTGVDFSQAGLDRARAHAEAVGSDVAARITWLRADVRAWMPPRRSFDLVSAQFMHQPAAVRRPLFARLADAVRPGGRLLVVGHHPLDLETHLDAHTDADAHPETGTATDVHAMQDAMFTAEDVAADLDPQHWHVEVAETVARTVPAPTEGPAHLRDAVLLARRAD